MLLLGVFWCLTNLCGANATTNVTANVTTEEKQPDLVEISCDGNSTGKLVYRFMNNKFGLYEPLQYEAKNSIYGALEQNIKINGTGDCFGLYIRFR